MLYIIVEIFSFVYAIERERSTGRDVFHNINVNSVELCDAR